MSTNRELSPQEPFGEYKIVNDERVPMTGQLEDCPVHGLCKCDSERSLYMCGAYGQEQKIEDVAKKNLFFHGTFD